MEPEVVDLGLPEFAIPRGSGPSCLAIRRREHLAVNVSHQAVTEHREDLAGHADATRVSVLGVEELEAIPVEVNIVPGESQ